MKIVNNHFVLSAHGIVPACGKHWEKRPPAPPAACFQEDNGSMRQSMKRLFALLTMLALTAGLLSGCAGSGPDTAGEPADTREPASEETPGRPNDEGQTPVEPEPVLTVAGTGYTGVFGPFFAQSEGDLDVVRLTQATLLSLDREGEAVLEGVYGQPGTSDGEPVVYLTLADCVITEDPVAGTVAYDFELRKDAVFSDGKPLTADDVIFTLYVLCDPAYDGPWSLGDLPILGLSSYRGGMSVCWPMILEDLAQGRDTAAAEYYTAKQASAFLSAWEEAGRRFTRSVTDHIAANYMDYSEAYIGFVPDEVREDPGLETAFAMVMWGYGDMSDETTFTAFSGASFDLADGERPDDGDFWAEMSARYGYDLDRLESEAATVSFRSMLERVLLERAPDVAGCVATDESAPTISGIEKTGEYSLRVTLFERCPAERFVFPVAPLHVYGSEAAFAPEQGTFGFPKGDLSAMRLYSAAPVGAGPYALESYDGRTVILRANERYWKGAPAIGRIDLVDMPEEEMLGAVLAGTVDLASPAFTEEAVRAAMDANGGGLTGDAVTTFLMARPGYGCIGIRADRVCVGGDAGSQASKALRKGIATLLALFREEAVEEYFGPRASVTEYPVSAVSWASPDPAEPGYRAAYSLDAEGREIYAEGMSSDQRYAAALAAARGFFRAAGYTGDENGGRFTMAPEGASLSYTLWLYGRGEGEHPAYVIAQRTRDALAELGIELVIRDTAEAGELWQAVETGEADIWAAARSCDADPGEDLLRNYLSSNRPGYGGTDTNYYGIDSWDLDSILRGAAAEPDRAARRAAYITAMEMVMDWGCEVPLYQNESALFLRTGSVRTETLTPGLSAAWTWMEDVERLELE